MDSRQIQYFIAVCEEGGFAKAASRLYITPQGVSKAIHKLEDELGVCLFETTTMGITLTRYGEALLDQAADYLNQHNRIVDSLAVMKKNMSHTLTIGMRSGMAAVLPQGFIPNFIEENPDIKVGIRSFTHENMPQAMENTGIKVWLCSGPFRKEEYEVLYQEEHTLFLIMAQTHPLARQEKIRMKDLQNVPLINIAQDMGQQSQLNRHMAKIGTAPLYLMNSADRSLTMELVQRGLAVSFHGGDFYKAFPGIVRREIADADIRFHCGVLVRKDAFQSEAISRFVSYARRVLQDPQRHPPRWK